MSVKARAASHQQWLEDLASLKRNAKARFADVAWDDGTGNFIHAHKVIVYSRAAGSFQQRYLAAPTSMHHESMLSLPNQRSHSRRSVTPSASAQSHDYSGPSSSGHSQDRCTSPTSMLSASSAAAIPLSLSGTDPALFEACLDYLYTGEKGAEGMAVLFDGFGDGVREEESEVDGAVKLREDLMYSWRSKLFADVTIALDDAAETTFTAHRAILCSRSPYFQSLLLGSYGDSRLNHFTLPSPPFTSASTTFILGYIYTGTLQFSSRKFDLTTAFEIWRGAAFLSLSLLQEEVELKIEGMANLQRAARIYNFALSPDVNSQRLARIVEPWIVDKFGDVWGGPHIGNLEYDAQKKLVREVCSRIKPESVTSIAKMTLNLRKRLELEKAMWAEHVAAMLSAIEDELVTILGRHLPAVVRSPGFVDLVDGVGFSTDVLEWILELIVRGLREATAPEAYQALVGSVLLREEGILIDAKVLVEDARNGILKYIQRKWIGIRAVRGFDDLEPWCLKELSDEIEVSVEDLLADAPKLGNIAARSTIRPSLGANGTIKATPPEKRRPSLPTHPTHATTTTTSTATTRTPRLSTTSTASRMTAATTASRSSSVASTSRTSTVAPPPLPRTNGASTTAARGASVSARGARGGASTSTTARPRPSTSSSTVPPLPTAFPSTSSPSATPSSTPRATPRGSATSSRPSASTSRPPTLSARSSSTSLRSTAPPVRPVRPAAISTSSRSAAGPSSVSPRLNAATSRPTATSTASPPATATSTTRRPPSLAPSLSTRPSASSLASTSSTPRPPPVPRLPAKPLTPSTARPRTTSTPSVAAKTVPASAKGKEKASAGSVASPATRRPPSVTSTKSTATLRRPASTTSITSVRAPATAARPSSAASVKSTTRKPTPTAAASLKSPIKPPEVNGTPTRPATGTPSRPGARATPSAKAKDTSAKEPTVIAEPKQQLPGTMLLSGIPCIVMVRSDRPTRFRAVVRYIGEVLWGEGQWVGVEVAESAIPPEAGELEWNNGEVAGVSYFKIAPSSARSSGRTTPSPSEGHHDLRPSAASSSNGGSVGGSGASSLRPPSRRQRRSSSSEPDRDGGPRKGLFVRPNQIVYVL